MPFIFSAAQLTNLRSLRAQGAIDGNYAKAYRYMADLLGTPNAGGQTTTAIAEQQ